MIKLVSTSSNLVHTDLELVSEDGLNISQSKWQYSNTPPKAGTTFFSCIIKSPFTGCTFLLDRTLLNAAFPLPSSIQHHDKWISAIATYKFKVTYVNEPTIHYRQHVDNLIGTFKYGPLGLIKRIKKNGRGSFWQYLEFRRKNRLEIVKAIYSQIDHQKHTRSYNDLQILIGIYGMSTDHENGISFIQYIMRMIRVRNELGIKNVLTEVTLTSISLLRSRYA